MNEKEIELLYRSFDDTLKPDEQKRLQEALANSKELRREKENIEAVRKALSSNKHQTFEPFFAERVMRRIKPVRQEKNGDVFYDSLFTIFRPIAITATFIILGIMSYNLVKTDQLSWEGVIAVQEVTLEEAFDPTLSLNLE